MKRSRTPRLIAAGVLLVLILLGVLLAPSILHFYHASLADINMDAGRYESAAGHLEWLYERSPADTDLCLRLANAYLSDGNTARAEYTLTRGIDSEAGQLALYQRLCAVYILQDKLLDAVEFIDEMPNPLVKEQLDAQRPDAPVLSPPPGRYEEAISLTVSVPEGADCYLSLSGADPSVPSILTDVYGGPITLPAGVTAVMAVTVRDGLPSAWTSCTYRLENIVEPMTFADPEMEKLLRGALQKPDGPVMSTDLWGITSLSAGAEPTRYATLSDLVHLRGLTELTLYGDGSRVDIAPLAALTGLKKLSLRQFGLNDSDLAVIAQWTWLEELDLPDNRIESLEPVAGLTNLTALGLSGNRVTVLTPLSDLTGLHRLNVSRNTVTNINPLATLSALTELSLAENRITSINAARPLIRLTSLDISHNGVADLSPLVGHTALTSLSARNCPVGSLEPLRDCTALVSLICTGGTVQSVEPLAGLTALRELWLDGHQIETLTGLEGCVALTDLRVNSNRLTALSPLSGLPALRMVAVEQNQLTSLDELTTCRALEEVFVYGNPMPEGSHTLQGTNAMIHYEQNYYAAQSTAAIQ